MDSFKYKPIVKGKDKLKEKFKKFGKNTTKGQRIKLNKINNKKK